MSGRPPKVLLIHASLGSGHKRAAQALYEALEERHVEAVIQDLLSFLPANLPALYPRCYNYMINDCRWLWKLLYHALDKPSRPYAPAKSFLQSWQFKKLREYIEAGEFTHIFSTHFASSALLTDWWQEKPSETKIFSVVTDHVAHRCWKRSGLHHYFVPSVAVADQLGEYGIPKEAITVSGIPISRSFRKPIARIEAREEWGCSGNEKLVLVLCSGWNLKKTTGLLMKLQSMDVDSRFLISTGPEGAKEQKIKKQFEGQANFTIFGFSSRIAEMMSACDLMISKPGGLIVSEALAMGLPQVLLSPIPGQEEANAFYAERNGAAICAKEKEDLGEIVRRLLANPDKLCDMRQAASAASRPEAANTIVAKAMPEIANPSASVVS